MLTESIRDPARKRNFFDTIYKRECIHFRKYSDEKDTNLCKCGLEHKNHKFVERIDVGKWTVTNSTSLIPTDAYGMIKFKGDPQHALNAQFVRLSFDTQPREIMKLFEEIWGLKRPEMVISIHGGSPIHGQADDLKLQPKVARAFQKGLIKAAKTTGAWVITTGLNQGATQFVAKALASARKYTRGRNKIVSIGIAPWGLLKNAPEFVAAGLDSTIPYHPRVHASNRRATLNDQHGYFLLVDNGTVGRYGAEFFLRRRFEEFLSQQLMITANKAIPVVAVVLGGGVMTIRTTLDYLTGAPRIPIVACEGSGGAGDLIAQVNRQLDNNQPYNQEFESAVKANIRYHCSREDLRHVGNINTLLKFCGYRHKMITGYKLSEEDGQLDVDHSILTALLTRGDLIFSDKLTLVLAWKRADIARKEVFKKGNDWTAAELDNVMMEALVLDRVDFVDLLVQNGCSMGSFMTIKKLEELYNTTRGPPATVLQFMMNQIVGRKIGDPYTLKDVGKLIENLIGGSYKSPYLRPTFGSVPIFDNPFNELLIWAVLCNRKDMAICFWQHGEDGLAKGLVAAKLFKECADQYGEYDPDLELSLSENAKEFEKLCTDLLNHCYQTNDDLTFELLTYELRGWPGQTCLGLAVLAENNQFLAHGACQILLTDLWCGGMRLHKRALLYTLFAVVLPCFVFYLIDFKTKGELRRQAQKGIERKVDEQRDENRGRCNKLSADRVQLLCREKVKEFMGAPITTFWCWSISYVVFVLIFGFSALIETKRETSLIEYFLLSYVVTYGMEMCRQVLISEERTCLEKLAKFGRDKWKVSKMLAIMAYVVAFIIRHWPEMVPYAHVIYALDCGFWVFRCLEISEVNSTLGQYMTVISKMLYDTKYVVSIMVICLFSFGVMRTSILHPYHKKWDWQILRNVTYKAYFMWYGEVFASDIDNCRPEMAGIGDCLPGNWLAATACAVYMMVTNIILFNLLVAMFNHIYVEVSAVSIRVWKFKRYHHVMEYENHPTLPPPFVIFYHVYALIMFFVRCIFSKCCSFPPADYALKLILTDHDVEELLDFEEGNMTDFNEQRNVTSYNAQNERIRRINDRQEFMSMKMDELLQAHDVAITALNEVSHKVRQLDQITKSGQGGQSSVSGGDDLTYSDRRSLEATDLVLPP